MKRSPYFLSLKGHQLQTGRPVAQLRKHQDPPPPPPPFASKIEDHLFIGDAFDALNEQGLREAKVTHILNCCPERKIPSYEWIQYLRLDIADHVGVDLDPVIAPSIEFISKAISDGGTVLVHCAAGISRSASIICAYRMIAHDESFKVALEKIRAIRNIVDPNISFLLYLQNLEDRFYTSSVFLSMFDALGNQKIQKFKGNYHKIICFIWALWPRSPLIADILNAD